MTSTGSTLVAAALAIAAWGCLGGSGGDGDADTDTDTGSDTGTDTSSDTDTDTDCPVPGQATAVQLGVGPIVDAGGGDLDGDGRMDLVVAVDGNGVASFVSSSCGVPEAADTALGGVDVTGLAVANLDEGGGIDVAVLDAARTLHALRGDDLGEMWGNTMSDLATAGAVIAAHLDTDADHDVAVFQAGYGRLSRVENTGTSWVVRVTLDLPAGISRAAAGDLGGNSRDEILFMGNGLVEVVSVADFDFSDIRPISGSAHAAAAFGDFDSDGDGDLVTAAGSTLERWDGDGSTTIAMGPTVALPAAIVDVAALDAGDGPGAVALAAGGGLHRVSGGLARGDDAETSASAIRVLGGDVDGDGRDDAVAIGSDGTAWVWRTE